MDRVKELEAKEWNRMKKLFPLSAQVGVICGKTPFLLGWIREGGRRIKAG